MMKKAVWVRATVSVTTCGGLFWWIDWRGVGGVLKAANGYWLVAAFIIMHVDRFFMAYKWLMLVRATDVPVSATAAVQAYYVSSFWAFFLPSSVGADAVRIIWLSKKVQRGATIASSVIIERLLGMLALAIVAVGGLVVFTVFIDVKVPGLSSTVWLLFAGSVIAVTGVFSQIVHRVARKLIGRFPHEGLSPVVEKARIATLAFKERPGLLTSFLILSIFEQAFPIIGNFVMAKAFSIDLSLLWLAVGIPITLAVARLPISVHGLGVQEGAYALIFSAAGVPPGKVVMMSLISRVLLLLSSLPGVLWSVSTAERVASVPVVTQGSDSMRAE
jgi:uncharacterized protein (TIRG00374 family)